MGTILPIDAALPALRAALRDEPNAVLVAEPGAGKTTRVPIAMMDEPYLAGRKIIMLEPRRIAARMAARYMASTLGEAVGERVGYRVRMDTRVSRHTVIEVVTEGVLTRMLQEDPALTDVGLLIFDEFHERNIHADVGLAFSLQAQSLLREDLRILVMSATLDAEPVAALLGGAPVVASVGRAYPVETRYAERRSVASVESRVVQAVLQALREHDQGDLLVFLPGVGEIRRTESQLRDACRDLRINPVIVPLHGSLPAEEQDRAVAPATDGMRKVVLATSIAESSLTVEGVRIVVDGGLIRVPKFSPRTGMSRLETVPVSRASADQRRGRAGRLGPGICYRLWTEQEHLLLPAQSTPEIAESDLAPLALELAAWGAADPRELRWLDPPPEAAFAQARELLVQLGALDGATGAITPDGRRMAGMSVHPRLAWMALSADALGLGPLSCELAALLSERDILRGAGSAPDADLRLRLRALRTAGGGGAAFGQYAVDAAACRRIKLQAEQWKREWGIGETNVRGESGGGSGGTDGNNGAGGTGGVGDNYSDQIGLLLSFAFPDRIAARRPNGKYLLSNGRGAAFGADQPLSQSPYVTAVELDDSGTDSRITLAAPISIEQLEAHHSERFAEWQEIAWDAAAQSVRGRARKQLGALVLREYPLQNPDPDKMLSALLEGIAQAGLELLPWTKQARQYQQRLQFLHQHDSNGAWPDVSDEALTASLEEWLGPHLYGMKSRSDLQRINLKESLELLLSWDQRRELESQAPTHIVVPSGSRIPVDYSDIEAPAISVRLQEVFGLQETPRIAHGKVPVVLHLLSPAHRPVQVTQDLANFWRETYFEVKKDLKGRYPKHYWPDDPYAAQPTNRAKPRQ